LFKLEDATMYGLSAALVGGKWTQRRVHGWEDRLSNSQARFHFKQAKQISETKLRCIWERLFEWLREMQKSTTFLKNASVSRNSPSIKKHTESQNSKRKGSIKARSRQISLACGPFNSDQSFHSVIDGYESLCRRLPSPRFSRRLE
jgi:hypothetical protein